MLRISSNGIIFPQAVELRLRKISGSLPQLAVLAFLLFEAFALRGGETTITTACITLMLTNSGAQAICAAANFRRERMDSCVLRTILSTLIQLHPDGPFTKFRGVTVC